MGQLRGSGNAIVPQVAAEFVMAFITAVAHEEKRGPLVQAVITKAAEVTSGEADYAGTALPELGYAVADLAKFDEENPA